MKQLSLKSRKNKPSFVLPPSLTKTGNDSTAILAAQVAKDYHSLACGVKHTAKCNAQAAAHEIKDAREFLLQTYIERQTQLDRSKQVLSASTLILNQATQDEHEACLYLKESNFIAAKYHATATAKENAASAAQKQAKLELEQERDLFETSLQQALDELDQAREQKAVCDYELKNATQQVQQSRQYLQQLQNDGDNDDALSVATECLASVSVKETFEDDVAASAVACLKNNNDLIISGSMDGTVQIWSVEAGGCVRTYNNGHSAKVNAILILEKNQDQSLFVTASNDGTCKLWNVATDDCLFTFIGHQDQVTSLACLDENHFCSASIDKTLKIWSLSNNTCVRTIRGQQHTELYTVATLDDQDRVLAAGSDKVIRLYNLLTGKCIKKFKGHTDAIHSLVVLDAERFVSCSRDGTVRLWDVASGKTIRTLKQQQEDVPTSVALVGAKSSSSSSMVVIAHGSSLRLWNLWTDVSQELEGHHEANVVSVASAQDGFCSASMDETIKLWNTSSDDDHGYGL